MKNLKFRGWYNAAFRLGQETRQILLKIQLVGQKNIETKHLSQVKARHQSFFTAKTLQIWRALFATSGL